MKREKKILSIIISLIMVALLVCNCSYAANENNDSKNDNKNNLVTENKKNNNNASKSSDSKLGDFGIKPHDFTGFKPDKTEYKVEVPDDCDKVEIYAVPKSEKATTVGTGFKSLKKGENKFDIVITAENGSKTTYKLTIVRGKTTGIDKEEVKEDKKEEKKEFKNGLDEFTIEGVELSPKFETGIYEYKADYHGEETTLKVNAIATDPYYDVDIIGNKDLKDGENPITILVSDPDGKNVATYQIILNKGPEIVEEENVQTVADVNEEETNKMMIVVGGVVTLVVIIIIMLIIAKRRDRKLTQEYSVPFAGINSDNDDDEYSEENDYWNVNSLSNNNDSNDVEFFNDEINDDSLNDNIVIQEDSEREKMRNEYLDGYSSDNYDDYDDYEEERPRRKGKHKAKRFK